MGPCLGFYSGNTCSLSSGLEYIGLVDIRVLVKLMCLSAHQVSMGGQKSQLNLTQDRTLSRDK